MTAEEKALLVEVRDLLREVVPVLRSDVPDPADCVEEVSPLRLLEIKKFARDVQRHGMDRARAMHGMARAGSGKKF